MNNEERVNIPDGAPDGIYKEQCPCQKDMSEVAADIDAPCQNGGAPEGAFEPCSSSDADRKAVCDTDVVGTAERELMEHGVYMTNTIGHSMEPFLSHHRDAVVIARTDCPPKKYDVVLYPGAGGSYILHRIIAVKADHFVIRGDNNYFREYVPKDKIIGVLVSFTRKGKRGSVKDIGYKLYSRRRVLCYPLRVFYRRTRAFLARVYRAVFKRKKK